MNDIFNLLKKNKAIRIPVIVISTLLFIAALTILIINYYKNQPPLEMAAYRQTINHIEWEITYHPDTKKIISVSAQYSITERSSEYWEQLRHYYGDSDVYVTHIITLKGTPLADDWYKIEKTEIISNGWDVNQIFSQTTIRYEEKLLFLIP